MSTNVTKHMLAAYKQDSPIPSFFSMMFVASVRNFFNSETIEIDIRRTGEKVAVVVTDLTTGSRFSSLRQFTNKEFNPPVLGEGFTLNKFQLMKRMAGDHPFQSVTFQVKAAELVVDNSRETEEMIRRHIELQCAQVLQLGKLTLYDEQGSAAYVLDFKPKAEHFPDSTTNWNQAGADPMSDLEKLADVIRKDGKRSPNQLIFGAKAWKYFIRNEEVKSLLDNRRINMGELMGGNDSGGGKFNGFITIGAYEYECWTYEGRYDDPADDVNKPFMDEEKVIMRDKTARMDATFGAIPFLVPPEQRALRYLPPRLQQTGPGGIDLYPNAWLTEDGGSVKATIQARPLMIPVAIDTYGCFNAFAV